MSAAASLPLTALERLSGGLHLLLGSINGLRIGSSLLSCLFGYLLLNSFGVPAVPLDVFARLVIRALRLSAFLRSGNRAESDSRERRR